MPFLTLGGVTVPVREGTFRSEPEAIGEVARAVSGRLRAAVSGYRYTHSFSTPPLTAAQAAPILALLGAVVTAGGDRFTPTKSVLVEPGDDDTMMAYLNNSLQNAARTLSLRLVEQ